MALDTLAVPLQCVAHDCPNCFGFELCSHIKLRPEENFTRISFTNTLARRPEHTFWDVSFCYAVYCVFISCFFSFYVLFPTLSISYPICVIYL